MSRKPPPLTWFRAFESAARNLSFTGAAAELGLTQSAVSQHVRSLELRLGVELFRRMPRGLALTDEGRRLLPDVGKAVATLTDLARAYDDRVAGPALTVATSVSFSQWYLAPGIAGFQARHGGVRVRIISTTWPDEYHRPIADVEIRFGSKALVGKDATQLLPSESIVIAAPSLTVDPAKLGAHPLIEPVGTSDIWRHWAEQTGYSGETEPSLLVDSHGIAVDLARRGAGVALTNSIIAGPCLADGSVTRVPVPSVPGIDGYFLAVNSTDNPMAEDFRHWLIDGIAKVRDASA